MKNNGKRILVFLLAMIMCFSCSAIAYADNMPSTPVYAEAQAVRNSELAVQGMQALTDVETVTTWSTGETVSGTFITSVSGTKNITIVISGNTGCTVTVKPVLGFGSISRYISSGGTYTIGTGSGMLKYEIRFHSAGSACAYQFFATDNYY